MSRFATIMSVLFVLTERKRETECVRGLLCPCTSKCVFVVDLLMFRDSSLFIVSIWMAQMRMISRLYRNESVGRLNHEKSNNIELIISRKAEHFMVPPNKIACGEYKRSERDAHCYIQQQHFLEILLNWLNK